MNVHEKYQNRNFMDVIKKYPDLFKRFYLPATQTQMCFGLQIGKGWEPIIDELCTQIQILINNQIVVKFAFACIKEKYGSLRIDYETSYPKKLPV